MTKLDPINFVGVTTRICRICSKEKPLERFVKDKRHPLGVGRYCRPCFSERQKGYYRQIPQELRRGKWQKARWDRRIGKSDVTYGVMFDAQGGVCAICKKPEAFLCRDRVTPKSLSLDHCHKTGKIRGLLCHACNVSLGLLKEDPDIFRAAIEYLNG